MFFGSTSTIISIIFGLGLQWILIMAGQDLVHKLLHKSPDKPKIEASSNSNCLDSSTTTHFSEHATPFYLNQKIKIPPLIPKQHCIVCINLFTQKFLPGTFVLRGPPCFA